MEWDSIGFKGGMMESRRGMGMSRAYGFVHTAFRRTCSSVARLGIENQHK